MLMKAYAKINIALDVVGKREDGYHMLNMIMQTIDLYDELNIDYIDQGIILKSNSTSIPLDEKNIAYKAAKIFLDTYNIKSGVAINIIKNIPIEAGLAGGSTDAAAVLKCMRDIYKPEIDDKELMKLGVRLGADVPYCIIGGTAVCTGIGEIVNKIKHFKNNILVIVKPSFGVSTKEVYKNLNLNYINQRPNVEELVKAIEKDDLSYVSKNMKNVLENVTLKKHTILKEIKDEINSMGALGTLMTGSGPTIFGFFEDMLKAQRCYDNMKYKYKEVFITRTI
jgi:4-diphosphocytidyl-2-C-methyl-D-erythritol kinase